MHIFGLDIGGSGVKGAPVDTQTGELLGERFRVPTPQPSTPEAVVAAVVEVVTHFGWHGPIGCGFPAVVKDGKVFTAANVDAGWIGTDLRGALHTALGQPVQVLNDADAAGLAEMRFGAGRGVEGVVLLITLGTGIGTALFVKGQLVPNTELGHIELKGKDAELRASDRVREERNLSWKHYAKRLDEYLDAIQRLLWPDLVIVGGGISKDADKFLPRLSSNAPVVVAKLLNNAGIVGAAMAAVPEAPAPAVLPVATHEVQTPARRKPRPQASTAADSRAARSQSTARTKGENKA